MLGLDIGRAELAGLISREEDHAPCLLRIAFEHECSPFAPGLRSVAVRVQLSGPSLDLLPASAQLARALSDLRRRRPLENLCSAPNSSLGWTGSLAQFPAVSVANPPRQEHPTLPTRQPGIPIPGSSYYNQTQIPPGKVLLSASPGLVSRPRDTLPRAEREAARPPAAESAYIARPDPGCGSQHRSEPVGYVQSFK